MKKTGAAGKCFLHFLSVLKCLVGSILSQCNTLLRLLHLLYDIDIWHKTIKQAFPMFYTLIKHGFLTNQSMDRVLSTVYYNIK